MEQDACHEAMGLGCPTCGASPFRRCTTKRGMWVKHFHEERVAQDGVGARPCSWQYGTAIVGVAEEGEALVRRR